MAVKEKGVAARSKEVRLYREMYRLSNEFMRVNRMSLTNWLEKGYIHFCGLICLSEE